MIYGSLPAFYPIFSRHHLRYGSDWSLCVFVFQQTFFFKEVLDGLKFIFPTVDIIPASVVFVNVISAHKYVVVGDFVMINKPSHSLLLFK